MNIHKRAMVDLEEPGGDIPAWERLGAISGIVFAVLCVVGLILVDPVSGESDQKFTSFYADRSNRIAVITGVYLLALAGASFLWFLGSLHSRLRRAEDGPGILSVVALAGGIVFVVMLCAAGAAMGVIATSMSLGGDPQPSPQTGRLLTQLGYTLLLIYGLLAAIIPIVATSALALRTGVFPRWLAWTGFVAAVLLLSGVIFVSALALPIWVIAVSVVMLRHGVAEQPAGRVSPSPA